MRSFSNLAIGLSFAFGCILMGLVAEVYYMLWWKKRIAKKTSTNPENEEESCFVFSWKKACFTNPEEQVAAPLDLEMGLPKENLKNFGEEGIESEIMRMHNLCGPPRFLFTIIEESREDLMEFEDGIPRKGSRLSDFLLSSPPPTTLKVVSPDSSNYTSNNHGFNNNPLFECLTEAEFNRFRSNSPPPSFKFLKDAEDKLIRKLLVEEAGKKRGVVSS